MTKRRTREGAQEESGPFNYRPIVIQVVTSLMPQGGAAIAQMTGLSVHDLIQTGMALAKAIDERWNSEGGSRRDSWIRRMLRNRIVDLLREANAITRTNYGVLQKIWERQEQLGGAQHASPSLWWCPVMCASLEPNSNRCERSELLTSSAPVRVVQRAAESASRDAQ